MKAETLLARAMFVSGIPLSTFERDEWKTFFDCIRPSFRVPRRYTISNRLLVEEFERTKAFVENKINSQKHLGLQLDGWSNIR